MIKDVLVHLDGSGEDEFRIQHAEVIAVGSGVHVTGLFTNPLTDIVAVMPIDAGAAAAQVIADLDDDARRQGDEIQQRLAERFARISVPNEIRRIDAIPGELLNRAVSEARWSDLFVMSRPYDADGAARWNGLFEAALFEGGRGVYVVPPGRKPADAIRRILVAWRDTRETTRAVAEAMPLIETAARTSVVLVDPDTGAPDARREPEMDIARHLGRHGAKVEVHMIDRNGRPVGDVILEQARRLSADLVVMGAYGHSRAREWVLGGATVEMLRKSEFPILMAH
jgi:nucleotide-binding universal stress UspA family protein